MDSKTVVPVSAPIRENKIQSNNIEADTTVIDAVTNGDISVSSND
jgi:hypothetical protein